MNWVNFDHSPFWPQWNPRFSSRSRSVFFTNRVPLKPLRIVKNVFLLLSGYLPLNCHLVRLVWFLSAREISLDYKACIGVVEVFTISLSFLIFLKWQQKMN